VTSVSRPGGGGGGGRYRNENARETAADVIVGKKLIKKQYDFPIDFRTNPVPKRYRETVPMTIRFFYSPQ